MVSEVAEQIKRIKRSLFIDTSKLLLAPSFKNHFSTASLPQPAQTQALVDRRDNTPPKEIFQSELVFGGSPR